MVLLSHLKKQFKDSINIRLFVRIIESSGSLSTRFRLYQLRHSESCGCSRAPETIRFYRSSSYQAFGRTGFEAMACGCIPVLPMKVEPLVTTDQVNALLVDTFNVEDVLSKIIH